MCSITGMYIFSNKSSDTSNLGASMKKALKALQNRGPDDSSFTFVKENCVIAGNRLIIRGDKKKDKMPYTNEGNVLFKVSLGLA
ncbi:MAG: hypothetical protein WDZ75_01600 [Candidatus Paceibacterota bacterium]